MTSEPVGAVLAAHVPADATEAEDLARLRQLAESTADPWPRSLPLHLTGSAVVLHPPTARVLLRWHEHLGRFLHVGGHGDPGEEDPFAVALREAEEETGLTDLRAFPGPEPLLVQVAIVPVPPKRSEPAHQHGDLRYLLATASPERAVPERPRAVLVWRPIDEARRELGDERLAFCLERAEQLLAG